MDMVSAAAASGRMAPEITQSKPIALEVKEANKETGVEAILAAYTNSAAADEPIKQAAGWETPIIDLSRLRGADRQLAVEQIALACREWGVFHVINHGIPERVFDDMWKAFDVLFQVPLEERRKFDNGLFLPPAIWKTLEERSITLDNFGESRDTIRFLELNPEDEGTIPLAPQQSREPSRAFFRELRDVGLELLEAISESLGLERDYIQRVSRNNMSINSSIHHYTPCPDGSTPVGLKPHRDVATLGILLQDGTSGLQADKDDRWVEVKPLPGSLVVNVGETIQIITNGKYPSVTHRVVTNKEKPRSSMCCFVLPTADAVLEPLPHLVSEENPAFYRGTWDDYVYKYFAGALNL